MCFGLILRGYHLRGMSITRLNAQILLDSVSLGDQGNTSS